MGTRRDPSSVRFDAVSMARGFVLATSLGLLTAAAYLWAATPQGLYAMGWLAGALSLGVVVWGRREEWW